MLTWKMWMDGFIRDEFRMLLRVLGHEDKYWYGRRRMEMSGFIMRVYSLGTFMVEYKPTDAPIVANHGLQITDGAQLADMEIYQRLVGKLIYLKHNPI